MATPPHVRAERQADRRRKGHRGRECLQAQQAVLVDRGADRVDFVAAAVAQ